MENKIFKSSELMNRFSNNAVITAENVKDFGEVIAISALKEVMAYSGKCLDDLYAGLVHDVFDYKSVNDTYSDGYDLAQTAICFLCGHIGERLNDKIKTDKNGHIVTVKQACYREVYHNIDDLRGNIYNTVSYENLTVREEPYIEFDENKEETDSDYIDNAIIKMNLNKGQIETLNCYMAGMTFVEIAQFLSVNLSTVWRRRLQLQQKYNDCIAIYGN